MGAFAYPSVDPALYAGIAPFPHANVEGAWDGTLLRACAAEIAAFIDWDGEKRFYGSKQKRYCGDITKLPAAVRSVVREASEPKFLRWLETLTGETALIPDPYLEGGGIHSIGTGGFLKIHADFNWHETLRLYRRLNVLIYLNDDWDDAWGGQIELFSDPRKDPEVSLPPTMNRMLVFTTDDASFHGHRHALRCPESVRRNSIALYYYSPIRPAANFAIARHTTDYREAPGERFSRSGLRSSLAAVRRALTG